MQKNLKENLDNLVLKYEVPSFIPNDPISIPHRFSKKEDIEIAGFLVSVYAWGNRLAILKSSDKLMNYLENSPYDFVMNASPAELKVLLQFYHRTLNGEDTLAIVEGLKRVYKEHGGPENLFAKQSSDEPLIARISRFRACLIKDFPQRTLRHIGDMEKGSAGKRLNMFLRWMVRPSTAGVDFGLWKCISPSELYLPLDIHSGRKARELGLLSRKQNDRKALEELMPKLREFCPEDPAKYDFALFASDLS